jgi:hypothetical protein
MSGIRATALGSTLTLILSCSGGEQQLVTTFLTAVQGGDEAMLAGLSLVEFPGSVTSWEILEVGPESNEPFALAEVREEFVALEKEIGSDAETHAAFLADNAGRAEEYQRRLQGDPDYQFTGEMTDFQTELEGRIEKRKELDAELEEIRRRILRLRDAAGLSLNTAVNDNFEGEVRGKVVRLKVLDGSEEKVYTFTLRRFELSDPERNLTPMSRWIIAEIEEQA